MVKSYFICMTIAPLVPVFCIEIRLKRVSINIGFIPVSDFKKKIDTPSSAAISYNMISRVPFKSNHPARPNSSATNTTGLPSCKCVIAAT